MFFYAGEPGAAVDHIGHDPGILSSRISGGAHVLTAPKLTESHQTRENGIRSDFNATPEQVSGGAEESGGWAYYGNCRITHYDDCEICCSVAGNATASGVYPTANHTVATGADLPFGTELLINGQVYIVEDRGVDPYQVDIFVDDHETAVALGMYYTDVYVRGTQD